jgi:hypothetical protein
MSRNRNDCSISIQTDRVHDGEAKTTVYTLQYYDTVPMRKQHILPLMGLHGFTVVILVVLLALAPSKCVRRLALQDLQPPTAKQYHA